MLWVLHFEDFMYFGIFWACCVFLRLSIFRKRINIRVLAMTNISFIFHSSVFNFPFFYSITFFYSIIVKFIIFNQYRKRAITFARLKVRNNTLSLAISLTNRWKLECQIEAEQLSFGNDQRIISIHCNSWESARALKFVRCPAGMRIYLDR